MTSTRLLALLVMAAAPVSAFAAGTPKPAPAPAVVAPALTCTSFRDDLTKALQGHKTNFERPLTITRGFAGETGDVEVRVLSTGDGIDGTLKCKGDEFRRFQVSAKAPVSDKLETMLKIYERAALTAAFRWDGGKSDVVVKAMSADAAEYLKASIERGDTFQSGKVEYHQGNALDLGLIWTDTDHTFIIASQDDE